MGEKHTPDSPFRKSELFSRRPLNAANILRLLVKLVFPRGRSSNRERLAAAMIDNPSGKSPSVLIPGQPAAICAVDHPKVGGAVPHQQLLGEANHGPEVRAGSNRLGSMDQESIGDKGDDTCTKFVS
jgi:hypothetical protein